jgi:pSer/pThr/pTyr-binding forkhead associated (FHA) protein
MAAQFQFVIRSGPNTGKVFPLDAPEIIVGREASNRVAINDAEVSRKHAKLTLHGSAYVIQDLGSTNGTFVNGQRITSTRVLNPGDSVSFGENIVLGYEGIVDPNVTVIASAPLPKTAAPIQRPAPAPVFTPPVPAPAYTPPTPTPSYSSRVPAAPLPAESLQEKKKFPIWVIIVITLVVLICACVGFFLIIDQLNLWCNVVPFLVPFLGGSCV